MNPYKNTEVYLVTWIGGSCGSFITTLINNLVYKLPSKKTMIFSENGNSHGNLITSNWKQRFSKDEHILNVNRPYTHIIPEDPIKPLIIFDHAAPDWEELFSIFPNAKHINVTYSAELGPLVEANLFYKTLAETNYDNKEQWEEFLHWRIPYHKEILSDLKNPKDITSTTAEQLFSGSIFPPAYPFYDDSEIPECYTNKVFNIKMYDILTDKYKVLTQLSYITGKHPTLDTNAIYDQYLSKQRELIRIKIPWFKLKNMNEDINE